MVLKACAVLFLILGVQWTLEWETLEPSDDTLVLTHVLFRHGNRTADKDHELYPKDPYLHEPYYPYGSGQLTKVGKHKEFSVGRSLRERYHNFLGEFYYPEVIEAYSTDYNRTKMSLQLVLAGLFPPREEDLFENSILWQPVPFNYLPKYQDKVLLGVLCPNYLEMYEDISNSQEILERFAQHSATFDYISEHTGLKVSRFFHLYNLYFGLSTEEEWGFTLPEWTRPVWPHTITNLAIQDYFVSMHTHEMRQMATGYYLEKVIEDTKNKILSSKSPGRKMHLYSAHENNIAELLISLGVFEHPHVPNYGAWVSLEVHFINNIYGIKVFYENHEGEEPQLLSIPDCGSFCPLDRFIAITEPLIPSPNLCGI
ncbi:venom acid phosphatase Acph-1-like [Dendroctonus ponderosae]|uniref:acid phosphatase n=1 Tax=Dendroctonus ponderosae TaxID=77166 RepID=J3JXC6_DENPD|nr:venom acid phosphatase Acph-1-like [Dendroctonus ponderosae]AEE62857.1 unknown [Dendroctonus ponderosae]ERL91264.1 hypothetical protein D910_08598 [Dendroctonus ponderosae]KAH1026710.1 hypothetical protein HUJ05_000337 [Dendroctonus ponderosae]KAH1026711.1 hypothetical protein HUJ05_000337 [Dendroctonus ponderosae]